MSLFRYPSKSGRALLNGTLPLRYCAARFAYSTPTWRLPVSGHVGSLVAVHSDIAGDRGKRFLVWEFLGLVDLVLYGKDFD